MSFDGLFTHAMIQELQPILLGGRLSRIHQPFAQELILTIRSNRRNHSLLLSANPTYARVQLTQSKFQSPATPSNFVITLRKHLEGSILKNIGQIANDRILTLTFQSRNEIGDLKNITFYVEIMNRHSNIVVVDDQSQKIIDAIKHVDITQDRYRELLPKVQYRLPPQQTKINPYDIFIREKFIKQHWSEIAALETETLINYIQNNLQGLDKISAGELSYQSQAAATEQQLRQIWNKFFQLPTNDQGYIYTKKYQQIFTAKSYSYLLAQDYQAQSFESLSQMLDTFYNDRARKDRIRQQASNLIQVLKRNLKRNQTKVKRLQKDLVKTESAEQYRIKGELLTTYIHQVNRGNQQVQLPNYYDNEQPLNIPLNPALSPARNAQNYFKTYQKLKKSIKHLQKQIENTTTEIDYLQGILSQLNYIDPNDLPGITAELQQQGYLKPQLNKKKRKVKLSHGSVYQASDRTTIRVGKNNLQNDYLTNRAADKRYTWLHIKDLPGSHVIIESFNPSPETLIEAAQLAAYFSKAGPESSKVPIDYTLIKNVHKPNGAKPGFVTYTNQKTLLVNPKITIPQIQ
ncbi:NFACT family protein [Bombilactobacillus folatiphilus]|uniref:Rqc2 homolog RqcH n=1 Tax=Bombilactobacillus folatiphilus TaxID=2923362 RepID=A0ABY4P6U8_9LACO|nr:NFACT RNA binding domain-containing protein [Bombilactobacillus folatiphilus]UQS81468.1 NFACT family protein [Bombilactobacillus folatiphilus]